MFGMSRKSESAESDVNLTRFRLAKARARSAGTAADQTAPVAPSGQRMDRGRYRSHAPRTSRNARRWWCVPGAEARRTPGVKAPGEGVRYFKRPLAE
jgi:hypothetical protein